MSAPHADQIVEGYLARLEVALAAVPPTRRSELVDEVQAHIAEGRAASHDETDATLFELVERLGDPRLIAAEALERSLEPGAPASTPMMRWGWLELAAILLSIVMWPVGAILVLLSRSWTRREKLIGVGLGAVPFLVNALFAPLMPMVIGPLVGGAGVPIAVPMLFAVIGALPLIAAGYLALRLYGRSSYLPGARDVVV
jgi:uncharacterized membrane protein